jgi:hypothetical protein
MPDDRVPHSCAGLRMSGISCLEIRHPGRTLSEHSESKWEWRVPRICLFCLFSVVILSAVKNLRILRAIGHHYIAGQRIVRKGPRSRGPRCGVSTGC